MSECFKSGLVYLLAEDLCAARELLFRLFPAVQGQCGEVFEVCPGLRVRPVSQVGEPKWLRVTVRPKVVFSENVSLGFLSGPYLSYWAAELKPLGEWLDELGVPAEQEKCPGGVSMKPNEQKPPLKGDYVAIPYRDLQVEDGVILLYGRGETPEAAVRALDGKGMTDYWYVKDGPVPIDVCECLPPDEAQEAAGYIWFTGETLWSGPCPLEQLADGLPSFLFVEGDAPTQYQHGMLDRIADEATSRLCFRRDQKSITEED
ncbi:hypothetical protein [Aliamphritea hakodatensis]|uniref:hypothetical protein n=1 Tax=Aliamphritea hakodatensis TaxID=2895352 RepID=UPI0022FD470A|nr:hypothetical protein [Aliamphritea hakodatensis]